MKTNPNNKFTASHRILHWSIALFMFVLFITGFLRMYWMNKKTIVTAIDTTLKNQSIAIEKDQLTPIAKSIQVPMCHLRSTTTGSFLRKYRKIIR